MTQRINQFFGWIILIIFVGIFFLFFKIYEFLTNPVIPAPTSMIYTLPTTGGVKQLADDLYHLHYLENPNYLIWLAYVSGKNELKAGQYQFDGGITPLALLDKLAKGDVIKHRVTFIEGWTLQQILATLKNLPDLKHTLATENIKSVVKALNIAQENPEGLFFPDTYQYTSNTADITILKNAYMRMKKILLSEWNNRAPNLLYRTPYEALIVASLIEKEAKLAKERPMVAAVILNRLKLNMPLQIDPTVIYGLGEKYQGNLTTSMLKIPSLYNTYLNKNLPPTPIASPGQDSIRAALHPAFGNFLYFVAKGDGGHTFSSNLKTHAKAVNKYRQWEAVNNASNYLMQKKLDMCVFVPKDLYFLCRE